MLNIEIQHGNLIKVVADAIVNPTNSFGWMGGSSASAIKHVEGAEIEDKVKAKAPLEIGTAIATPAGKLPYKAIIHSPVVISPTDMAEAYNVGLAVQGALILADDKGFKIIAMPGMGTGVGSFPIKDAAKVMIAEIKKFKPINLEKVILIDENDELAKAWKEELEKK
ncbi:macro domain-containing protein [Candidatus Falkowbacteria bacterium]|nr:macro domain-containing protein [Candidatus Falkowbacteria bacterium]